MSTTDFSEKIDLLRKLILQASPGEDDTELRPLDEVIEAAPDQGEVAAPDPHDPDARPASLEGLTLMEILVLQTDGRLSAGEEDWLAGKNLPAPYGSGMPNLKAILRRQKKGGNGA